MPAVAVTWASIVQSRILCMLTFCFKWIFLHILKSCVNDTASFLGLSCDYLFKKALFQLKSVINLAATLQMTSCILHIS